MSRLTFRVFIDMSKSNKILLMDVAVFSLFYIKRDKSSVMLEHRALEYGWVQM